MAENSGGFVNYYLAQVEHPQRPEQPPYQAECEDIIRALGMTFDEGNIFKEIWRSAAARKGLQKEGHTALRGAQKMVHYSKAILKQRELECSSQTIATSHSPLLSGLPLMTMTLLVEKTVYP